MGQRSWSLWCNVNACAGAVLTVCVLYHGSPRGWTQASTLFSRSMAQAGCAMCITPQGCCQRPPTSHRRRPTRL